ncbi:hypothetical protein C7A10_32710, partial [Pseudomonas fluorescens]
SPGPALERLHIAAEQLLQCLLIARARPVEQTKGRLGIPKVVRHRGAADCARILARLSGFLSRDVTAIEIHIGGIG